MFKYSMEDETAATEVPVASEATTACSLDDGGHPGSPQCANFAQDVQMNLATFSSFSFLRDGGTS